MKKRFVRSSLLVILMFVSSMLLTGCDASKIMDVVEKALPVIKNIVSSFTGNASSTQNIGTTSQPSQAPAKNAPPTLEE